MIQAVFNAMMTVLLARFVLNDLPHAAGLLGNPGMEEWEKWEAMMASIRQAARILGEELTEADMPEYLNWGVGRRMHQDLWAQVYGKSRLQKAKKWHT